MSDTVADPRLSLGAAPEPMSPSPAKGLLWGMLLSIPLWAVIGLLAARLF